MAEVPREMPEPRSCRKTIIEPHILEDSIPMASCRNPRGIVGVCPSSLPPMCFVDMEKAYDCVLQGILWGHCRSIGYRRGHNNKPLGLCLPDSCAYIVSWMSNNLTGCCTLPELCLMTIRCMISLDRISRHSQGVEFGSLHLCLLQTRWFWYFQIIR